MSRPTGVNSEDTKQFIVDVATKIFEHKGYSATSMADIKNASNLSKGTIYYHFKNKEQLYLFCIEQVSKEFIRNWEITSHKEQSAEERLYIWANLNNIMLQKPIMNTVQEYFVSMNKDNLDAIIELYEPEFQIVSRIVSEGVQNGEFKKNLKVEDVAILLYSFINSLANIELYGYRSKQQQENIYKLAIDLILPGLKV